jgi:hypothetical protein
MITYLSTLASYLFAKFPGAEFSYKWHVLTLAVILILGAAAFKTIYRKKVANKDFVFKKIFKKVPGRMIYLGILLIFFILVRIENIPYFSMRIWMILTLLGVVISAVYYLYKYFKVYPKELENFESRIVGEPKAVYLPNKKKK